MSRKEIEVLYLEVEHIMTKVENSSSESLDDLFDEFLSAPPIFRNREVLRPTYVPERLPHRTPQVRALGAPLASALRAATPSNLFLYGKTGTGKTVVVLNVLNTLQSKSEDCGFPMRSAYTNCRIVDTNYRVLAHLCGALDVQIPFTGLPTDEVYSRFCNALDRVGGLFIIVLDEVDALVKKSGDETLYNLTRINTELKSARVSLIGISNDLKFKEHLNARVLSCLSEEEIVFPPYRAEELHDILRERAEEGFEVGVLEKAVIPIIAGLAAREHGDARRALDLLRVAGEIAERTSTTPVAESHVREAQGAIERNTVSECISTLPLQSKLVLFAIYQLTLAQTGRLTTGAVYEQYLDTAGAVGVDSITQRRVSDLINELDTLGIVIARVQSRGRYGRTKHLYLSVPTSSIKDALVTDRHLQSMV